MPQSHHDLKGRHVLVVEDEFYIAIDMADALKERGAHVVGPAASVGDAIELVEHAERLDGAVVDLNLRGELAFPVARALAERHVPFVFATGYDAEIIPAEFRDIIRCEKAGGLHEGRAHPVLQKAAFRAPVTLAAAGAMTRVAGA